LRCLFWRGLAALCTVAALSLLLSVAAGPSGRRGRPQDEGFELLFEGEVPDEDFVLHAGSVCFGASEVDLAGYIRLEVESDRQVPYGGRDQCAEWMVEDSLLLPEERDPRGLAFLWPNRSAPFRGPFGPNLSELQEEPADFAPWGETVCGFEEYKLGPELRAIFEDSSTDLRFVGRVIYVPSRGFLPLLLDTSRVKHLLLPKEVLVKKHPYLVPFEGVGHGLRYQPTLSSHGKDLGELVPPGSLVLGFVRLGSEFVWAPEGGYLPMRVHGLPTLLPLDDSRAADPLHVHGSLSWMLFDDQPKHWGALQDRFNESTFDEKARKSNTIFSFPAPPWNVKMYRHNPTVRENFVRHWHIVLAGAKLRQNHTRSRYRVFARKHLSSFGPNNIRPEKCPGVSPLVWLRRAARQGYDNFIAD
jgi:hypothetical protein